MEPALKLARGIDRISERFGKIVAWLCFPLVLALVYEVTARYVFKAPTEWAYDVTYMLYGTIFMLGAAYTLLKRGHIRTDFFYNNWPPKKQGKIDTIMYILFYFPGILFFLIAGWDYAAHSWSTFEHTSLSPWRPIIFPFKTVIPVTAFLLLAQGVSELIKSIHAWKQGEWV